MLSVYMPVTHAMSQSAQYTETASVPSFWCFETNNGSHFAFKENEMGPLMKEKSSGTSIMQRQPPPHPHPPTHTHTHNGALAQYELHFIHSVLVFGSGGSMKRQLPQKKREGLCERV